MKRIITLVVLLLAGGLLARTNPDEDAFREYVSDRVEQRIADEAGDGRLGRLLTDLGSGVAGSVAARTAERTDAIILSVYTIDLGADDRSEEKWVFLGIAGQFFEIRKPESLR